METCILPSGVIAEQLDSEMSGELQRFSRNEFKTASITYRKIGQLEKMGLIERQFKHRVPVFALTARGLSVQSFLSPNTPKL